MATHPPSPKANAPSTLAMEPTIPTEAVVETELAPVPESTEPVIREQDRLMPIANVVRVMRRMLPAHAKVADDAKEVIQECVSEFISFVTGEANERCHGEHRKTVTAEDIVWAMERLGFDNYVAPLKSYLQRMRDSEGTGRVFGGRGDRAHQTSRAPPQPVPMAALHGMRAQHVAFPSAALAHGYGVPVQVPFSVAPRFRAHQHVMLGGERSMAAAYYGATKPLTDGNNGGGCGKGTSSSSSEEQPAAGTSPRLQYPN